MDVNEELNFLGKFKKKKIGAWGRGRVVGGGGWGESGTGWGSGGCE